MLCKKVLSTFFENWRLNSKRIIFFKMKNTGQFSTKQIDWGRKNKSDLETKIESHVKNFAKMKARKKKSIKNPNAMGWGTATTATAALYR